MAPSIDRLLDHTVRVWRASVTQDNLGAEKREYILLSSPQAKLNRHVAPFAPQAGSGLAPVGRLRLYLRPDIDVRARDVIEVLEPADIAHLLWEVDEPLSRPMQHHTQLDCIAWHGELPEVES